MEDEELLRNLERDDRYSVIKVLAEREGHSTELVRDPYARILIRKRISPELANERAWRTLAQLDSPLVPRVYEIYHLPDCLTVIVAYVEGISASELVDQTGPVSPLTAAGYLHDICPAVALLHAHNLVHRDITPANVVVSQGTAHLIDLGIARAYDEEASRDTVLLGTWGFAAPEQYGFTQTDARSDIYALGGLLGFLLTGLRPDDQNFEAALHNGALVPEELCAIVVRARAFEPSARFQSADEMDAAIRAAIETLCTTQAQRPALPGDASTKPRAGQRTRTQAQTRARVREQPVEQPFERPTKRPAERPVEAPTMPNEPRAEA
ncbi:MAG: serine/threonine-protein kinase, partial [Coriobacteriales bacterium]|nr:serine/threonine-protein kinase [Coriobacteriales bacterium]